MLVQIRITKRNDKQLYYVPFNTIKKKPFINIYELNYCHYICLILM